MQRLERAVLRFVLARVLARACPSPIPRSGTEGERVNCFTTTYSDTDDPYLFLESIAGDEVSGLVFDGQSYKTPKTIAIDDIDPKRLVVTHYYGLGEVVYAGARDVAKGLVFGWPYAKIHLRWLLDRVHQRLFNTRTLVVRQRLDILRDVLAASEGRTEGVGAVDLMSHRHGYRWAGHPNWKAHHEALKLHLELLSDSGELKKANHGYRPTGLALKTLEDSEEQDRKHSANIRVQLLLAFLAVVSSAAAVIQAGLVRLPTLLDFSEKPQQAELARVETPAQDAGQPGSPDVVERPAPAASLDGPAPTPTAPSASHPSGGGSR